ncbi:MAG: energy transducer TonB [Pyrinomonadaceae bacterium]
MKEINRTHCKFVAGPVVGLVTILFLAAGIFAQARTCDLKLEVIENPKSDDVIETPIGDATASFVDNATKKTVKSEFNSGDPIFKGLTEGHYELKVAKRKYKTTLKEMDLNCALADEKGVVSEIVFMWRGNQRDSEQMSMINQSGGQIIRRVKSPYTDAARAAHISGTVRVQMKIDEQGNVIAAEALSGHPLLRPSAIWAAMQFKFSPLYKNGKPAPHIKVLEFVFAIR